MHSLVLPLVSNVLLAATSTPGTGLAEVLTWAEFKTAFGRNFSATEAGSAAEPRREAAFDANVARIREHNAQAHLHGFRLGVNQYSDLDDEEFSRRLGNRRGAWMLTSHGSSIAMQANQQAGSALPASVDWRTKNAVTAVKNQGNCGACWAFSVTGAIEGAYAIATGALRSLSEQQMIDCSTSTGNGGCHGGNQANAFTYAISNKGLDSEKDYAYDGADDPCWTAAAKRVVATVDSTTNVPPNDEEALAAAVAIAPVAVSIEASTKFRQYKSGIFQGAMSCGNTSASLNHAVLIVGFTADAWIVKNSWGESFGQSGYIMMARAKPGGSGVPPQGTCGIAADGMYAVKAKGNPVPIPPPTPGGKPALPCNCSRSCRSMCGQIGLMCCGGGSGCACESGCPQCAPKHDPVDYTQCGGSTPECPNCINGYKFCAPSCDKPGNWPVGTHCPTPPKSLNTTLPPYCIFENNGASQNNVCGLLCTVSAQCKSSPSDGCCVWSNGSSCNNDGCPTGAVCYPINDTGVPDKCAKGTESGNDGDCGTCLFRAAHKYS